MIMKKVSVTIVDDNQWEPDEEFFLKLALVKKVLNHSNEYDIRIFKGYCISAAQKINKLSE